MIAKGSRVATAFVTWHSWRGFYLAGRKGKGLEQVSLLGSWCWRMRDLGRFHTHSRRLSSRSFHLIVAGLEQWLHVLFFFFFQSSGALCRLRTDSTSGLHIWQWTQKSYSSRLSIILVLGNREISCLEVCRAHLSCSGRWLLPLLLLLLALLFPLFCFPFLFLP